MAGGMRRAALAAAAAAAAAAAVLVAAAAPASGAAAGRLAGGASVRQASASRVRINCGGPAVGDYLADAPFTDTSLSKTLLAPPPGVERANLSDAARALYTVRYVERPPRVLEYTLPGAAGEVASVVATFAEVYHTNASERVVWVELWSGGERLLRSNRFDIFGRVGRFRPLPLTLSQVRLDGDLVVRVLSAVGNPVLSTLEVVTVAAGDEAPLLLPLPSPLVPLPSPEGPLPSPDVPLPSPLIPLPSPDVLLPSPLIPLPSPDVPLPSPLIPLPSPDGPLPDDDAVGGGGGGNGSAPGTDHPWGGGWFVMLNAGAPGSANLTGVSLRSRARRFPAALPAGFDSLSYTDAVGSVCMVAAPGVPLTYDFEVPMEGLYEVILGWRELFFEGPGQRVFDVEVSTDETPRPVTLLKDLDVWALTRGGPELVVAHLPGARPSRGDADDDEPAEAFKATERLTVTLRPSVEAAFVSAIIVRQVPVFPPGSKANMRSPSMPDVAPPPPGVAPPPAPSAEAPAAPEPSVTPTLTPSVSPTTMPTASPSATPSATPSVAPSVSPSVAPTPVEEPPAPPAASGSRVNMGGPTDGEWEADASFFPSTVRLGNTFTASAANAEELEVVDQTIRWNETLTYTLLLSPGAYEIGVRSVELFYTDAGRRVFDVTVAVDGGEPAMLAEGVDLAGTVGALTPATWTVEADVERRVTVRLVGLRNNACISALWALPLV